MNETKKRAQEEVERDSRRGVFLLISGVELAEDVYAAWPGREAVSLEPVFNPPGLVDLAAALLPGAKLASFGLGEMKSRDLYEFYLTEELGDHDQVMHIAQSYVSLILLRSGVSVRVIAATDRSWNTVAAFTDEVHVWILGRDWHHAPTWGPKLIQRDDVAWVEERLEPAVKLSVTSPTFNMALGISVESRFQGPRTAIAAIWGGIEAILGVDQELSFRISHYLSHILSDDPRTRSQRKAAIRKLYSQRSKAVHGVGMKEADLERVRSESWELLSQVLQQLN